MKNILLTIILTTLPGYYLLSTNIEPPKVPKRPALNELKDSIISPIKVQGKYNIKNIKSRTSRIEESSKYNEKQQ